MPLKAEVQDIYDLKEAAKRGEGVFPYLENVTARRRMAMQGAKMVD